MEGIKGQCFICERQVNDQSATPDRGEDAVFVLRKVLQAPDSVLEKFLKGTPSDCGLAVCQECRPLLSECRAVHEELFRVKRKWIEVKAKVVNRMKVSAAPEREEVSDIDVRKGRRGLVIQYLHGGASESRLLPSGQDSQRSAVPGDTPEGDAKSLMSPDDVVIEHVVEDDGDGFLEEVLAPSPEQLLMRLASDEPKREIPGVKKQSISSQRIRMPKDCVFCPSKFPSPAELERHLLVHTRERPFWCGVCGREFAQTGQLSRHLLVHTGEKAHQCELCKKRFATSGHLSRHVRGHLEEKPWKCPDCGKAYVEKDGLTAHRVVHTGEKLDKSFECLFCPARWVDLTALNKHLRMHTGERPYWCEICGKEFTQGSHLKQHKRIVHSGEKPHQCNLCKKRFSLRCNLNLHLKSHLAEKPWKCSDCGKAFVTKGNLTQHRVVHTGEKPFKCDLCGNRFSRGDSLSKHQKRLHSAVVVKVKSTK